MLAHQIDLKIPVSTFSLSNILENIDAFWSVGVRGYWSVEGLFITPILRYSITPTPRRQQAVYSAINFS